MRIGLLAAIGALLAGVLGSQAPAANLIVNGDFESVTNFGSNPVHSSIFGTFNSFNPGPNNALPVVTGWRTEGYNFVFMNDSPGGITATSADNGTAGGAYTNDSPLNARLGFWGPDSGVPGNGFNSRAGGGNFVGADAAFGNAPIYQVINGLQVGKTYELKFWWAAAQQSGYFGETRESWKVCFGVCAYTTVQYDGYATYTPNPLNIIQQTEVVINPSMGFTPWRQTSMLFTATSTSQTLSLLAYGTPLGQPPFALIDGLSMEAVPEPTTWGMMLIGFGLVGGIMRSRRPTLAARSIGNQIV